MLIWFEVILMLYCGLLIMCLICEVCVESGSYIYFMIFFARSIKEYVLYKCPFRMVLLNINILSALNVVIPYVSLSLKL